MKKVTRILAIAAQRMRGVKVTALVGKSGSGKSFRARLIAQKRGLEIIIDDGLVIGEGTILTGHWAKKEKYLVTAVRRALFAEETHAREAREALRNRPLRGVLVTATSRRMARRITENLWLPPPSETILIEDVATRNEIAAAHRRRARRGAHSSPVPDVRIRRSPMSYLRSLLGRSRRGEPAGATIAAPRASAQGSVVFSEAALSQMAVHCVQEFDPRIHVLRVSFLEDGGMSVLELSLRIPGSAGGSGRLHDLRDSIMHDMERHAGLIVRDVRLIVEEIETPHAPSAPPSPTS